MKRVLSIAITASLAAALPVLAAKTQGTTATPTADSLVARNLDARGGAERLRAIRSFKQTGMVTIGELPAPVPLILYGKRPNLQREDIGLPTGAIVVGFDGTRAWKIDPGAGATTAVPVTGPQGDAIEEQSEFDALLLDYKKKGVSVEYVGPDTFAGKNVEHLKVIDKKGRVQHCYLDATTALELRVLSGQGPTALEQQLSDYRPVNGVKFPFVMRSLTSGRVAATITIEKIELDVPIDDALFKMPPK